MRIKREFLDVFKDSAEVFVDQFRLQGNPTVSMLVEVMASEYRQLSFNKDRLDASLEANAHSAICAVLSKVAIL